MTQMVIPSNRSKIEAAFEQFHSEHPEVYGELVELAREMKARGYERFGIATIYEVARWRSMLRARDGHGFKLNNSHRALYARTIMAQESDLEGVFDTRRLAVAGHVV